MSYYAVALNILGASSELATQNISGALSGAYTKKRYYVTADCSVASGVDVSFAAGSFIEFDGDYKIDVIGQIQLNGTSGEHITIKPSAANSNNRWRGFRLCTTSGDSFSSGENSTTQKFTYCDFSYAEKLQETASNYHRTRGAAIFSYLNESLEITNCTFTSCRGYDYGGTVYIHMETGGTLTFNNCTFTSCEATSVNSGAGAWVITHSTATVSGMAYNSVSSAYGIGISYTVVTATDIFTTATHYMITGNIVKFAAGTNAPTPLTSGVEYYAIVLSATTFKLASSYANANAGTAIDITAQASGTKIMNQLQEFSAFDATITINV
jgi:hypothetical protein